MTTPPAPAELPVVFACSGCSDVGEIADRAARTLSRAGVIRMSCIAGVGGRVGGIMNPLRKAAHIIVVDGCKLHCCKHTLEAAGFARFDHISLPDLGLVKHQSEPDATTMARVCDAIRARLVG